MKKISLMALTVLVLSSCNSDPKFNIKGEVSDADGKMLYFESSGLEGVVAIDSVELGKNGSFSFKQLRPESPEFYRLRIEDKVVNLSVDSTETIEVKAPYAKFSTDYDVAGSENCVKIKELTLKQIKLQSDVDALFKSLQDNVITHDVFEGSLSAVITKYKDNVKVN